MDHLEAIVETKNMSYDHKILDLKNKINGFL